MAQGWLGWLRVASKHAGVLLFIALLGATGIEVVNVFMEANPDTMPHDCTGPGDAGSAVPQAGMWFDFRGPDDYRCRWDVDLAELDPLGVQHPRSPLLTRTVDVTQNRGGGLDVRETAVVPARSALARDVQQGLATRNIFAFGDAVWGTPLINDTISVSDWRAPTLTLTPGDANATITLTGSLPGTSGTLSLAPPGPTTLHVNLADDRITSLQSDWIVTAQQGQSLTAHMDGSTGNRLLSLQLASVAGPPNGGSSSWAVGLSQLLPGLSEAKAGLLSAGEALLTVAGWLMLLLATRFSPLASLESDADGRRLTRLVGAVVAVHCAFWVGTNLDAVQNLGEVLGGSAVASALNKGTGWAAVGFTPVSAAIVLVIALGLAALPVTAARLGREMLPGSAPGALQRRPLLYAVPATAALTAASFALLRLYDLQTAAHGSEFPADAASRVTLVLLPWVLFAVLSGLSLVAVRVGAAVGWRLHRAPLLAAASVTPLLAVGAEITTQGGVLPFLLLRFIPLLSGFVTVLALSCVVWTVGLQRPCTARLLPALSPVALAVALVWHRDRGSVPSWWDYSALAQGGDALLGFLLVIALLRSLRAVGGDPSPGAARLPAMRVFGIVAVFVLGAGSYDLGSIHSLPSVLCAAVVALVVFPRPQMIRAQALSRLSAAQRSDAVERVTRAGTARRALPLLRKAARDTSTESDVAFTEAQARLRSTERASYEDENALLASQRPELTARQCAFGVGPGDTPWTRGIDAARAGAVIGLPWTLLSLAEATVRSAAGQMHPVLVVLDTVLPALLVWPGFGFLFGYFFPLLRGATGFAKALWLAGILGIPAAMQTLASTGSSHWSFWTSTLLYGIQAVAFASTLGLWADACVLKAHRLRPARLADTHNFGTITAWGSSVTVALATGIATLIMTGLQPFLLDVFPQPPTPAPASVATSGR